MNFKRELPYFKLLKSYLDTSCRSEYAKDPDVQTDISRNHIYTNICKFIHTITNK